jgi:hypothetical protein
MRIELPFDEAVRLGTLRSPLPALVQSLRCEGSTVFADVDLRALHTDSFLFALALAAAGSVAVAAAFTGFEDGVATFALTAHARGLPAHRLVPFLLSQVNEGIERSGVPTGVVEVTAGVPDPLVRVAVQAAVNTIAEGVAVQDFRLTDGVLVLEATIGSIRLLAPDAPNPVDSAS